MEIEICAGEIVVKNTRLVIEGFPGFSVSIVYVALASVAISLMQLRLHNLLANLFSNGIDEKIR